MSIRARVLTIIVVVLAGAFTASYLSTVRSSASAFESQADAILEDLGEEVRVNADRGNALAARSFAHLVIDQTGTIVALSPSGAPSEPDALPEIDVLQNSQPDGPVSTTSVEGTVSYRAIWIDGPTFNHVVAVPTNAALIARREHRNSAFPAAIVIATLAAAVCWVLVSRALRPLQRMATAAQDIASGSRKTTLNDASGQAAAPELRRLGGALDDMVDNVDKALAGEREANQKLRRFVDDASHELRTPLAGILGFAELHERGGITTDEQRADAFVRINEQATRLKRLADDLLTLSRSDHDAVFDAEVIDLTALVRRTADELALQRVAAEIVVVAPQSVLIFGDEDEMVSLVTNLVANAVDHGGHRVEVRLIVEADAWIELVISDDGPGVSAEHLPHIFERFYRADSSRSRQSGGAGLGLAIVRSIAESHGGTASAENQVVGGLVVVVRLPRPDNAHAVEPH